VRRPTLLLGFALFCGCGGRPLGPLDRPIVPQFVAEAGAAELLSICREVDMPCGFELLPSDANKHTEAVPNMRDAGTARKLLDELVKRRPAYRWFLTKDEKVLNVAPRKIGANDPLDRRVFVNAQNLPAENVLKLLVESAGLKLVAPPAPREEVYGEATRPGKVSLTVNNMRLRLALNRLVQAEGKSMWWCAQLSDPDALRCAVQGWRGEPPGLRRD
jgi:hypothetical protein